MKYLVRINEGAKISQDQQGGIWPHCLPPKSEYIDDPENYEHKTKYPDAIFTAEDKGNYWDCVRDGYGAMKSKGVAGDYGNGSIFVLGKNCITIMKYFNDNSELMQTCNMDERTNEQKLLDKIKKMNEEFDPLKLIGLANNEIVIFNKICEDRNLTKNSLVKQALRCYQIIDSGAGVGNFLKANDIKFPPSSVTD